jgi:excisionase family DNA binding protein
MTTARKPAPTTKGQSRAVRPYSGALPNAAARPVISAEEAFALLGIHRSTGYKSIRDSSFPLPTFKVGNKIRIPTAAVLRLLHLTVPTEDDELQDEVGA